MEPTRENAKTPDRWYLHVQGRTVGPLAGEEVTFGLKTGEFLPGDKIANSRHPIWRRISEHPVFCQFAATETVPRSALLKAPPPPRLLRIRPVVPPQVPASVPARPVAEPVTELKEIEKEEIAEAMPAPVQEVAPETERNPEPKPEPNIELAPAGASAHHPLATAEDLDDPETNASLEAATKELEKVLANLRQPEPKQETDLSGIPTRPELQTIFLADPAPRARPEASPASRAPARRVIQIELKFPERPLRWLVLAALVFGAAYYAGIFARKGELPTASSGLEENKTRDLEKFPLPDPSSPSNTPPEAGDPNPPLKAPTRPQRD